MNSDLGNTITQAITIVCGEPFLDLHLERQFPICRTFAKRGVDGAAPYTQEASSVVF